MRIIKRGNPEAALPWYRQIQWTCRICDTVFKVDDDDEVVRTWADHYNGDAHYAAIHCPVCNNNVTVSSENAQ